MFTIVAIKAKQFPIASVERIIVVVVVPVVDRQFTQVFAVEFARTPAAYPGIHFQCSFAVRILPCSPLPVCLRYDLVKFVGFLHVSAVFPDEMFLSLFRSNYASLHRGVN